MLWSTLVEFDLVLNVLMLIVFGLGSLRSRSITLPEITTLVVAMVLMLAPYTQLGVISLDTPISQIIASALSIEGLLALVMVVVLTHVRSLEGIVLLLIAYASQVYMVHSVDLLSFYVTLELGNFVFMVLCGLPSTRTSTGASSYTVEAGLKFLVLSAFSSGVLLYWFSAMYQLTGVTSLAFRGIEYDTLADGTQYLHSLLLLAVVMFKLGAAPVHLWVVQVYGVVDRWLLFYISTAPKISLFGFWVGAFQGVWTEYSILPFALLSTGLGALGAYSQSRVRMLLAYSTLNEIGLLLSAAETAGFNSLLQHLAIYVTAQVLLWTLLDTRLFPTLAVSLAGLPPLAGFFGKSWVFWHLGTVGSNTLLLVALVFTVLSLVYYVRLIRLFYAPRPEGATRYCRPAVTTVSSSAVYTSTYSMVAVTSMATVLLVLLPFIVIRPFVIA
jgi:NADH:ubiquinone oxidoreductase subunit 2 (subunit N)